MDLDDQELEATRKIPCKKIEVHKYDTEKILEELKKVRPEKLNEEAKRLFESIMKIANEKDEAKADLYSTNQIISEQIETIKKQDKMIEDFISEIIRMIYCYENYKECKFDYEISESITETRENIRKYFEERCK